MLQLFRSFRWASLVIVLGLALGLRAVPLLLAQTLTPLAEAGTTTWGNQLMSGLAGHLWLGYFLGAVVVCLIGFVGAYSLQAYRLSAGGTVPALVAILLGSALISWVGFGPELLAALALALAGHVLFGAYRHQGASLPVYNGGLWLGVAWLLAPGYVWFGLWGLLALVQLRKVRLSDALGYVLGFITLPLITGIYYYATHQLQVFITDLFDGSMQLMQLATVRTAALPLGILALASVVCFVAYGSLTTRRPVQEQRANRMWFSMLGAGWLILLLTGAAGTWTVAYVLPPLSVLLGVWLLERDRRLAEGLLLAALLVVLAGYAFLATLG